VNLDRLKALIRLANNNPNEHEANLAARKACKLIAEKDFAILYANHIPRTVAEKINQPRTWNDVKRSTEPDFKSKTYDPPKPHPFDTIFEEMFNRAKGRPFSSGDWGHSRWKDAPRKEAPEPSSYDEPRYSAWAREYPFNKPPDNSNYNPDGTKKKKPEELRKCAKCGLEIMTSRLKEDPWVCNPCHWKEYP
jgi:hypothetical protein